MSVYISTYNVFLIQTVRQVMTNTQLIATLRHLHIVYFKNRQLKAECCHLSSKSQ